MNDPHAEELFTYFFPHVASNTAYVRAIGQFFAMEYLQKKGIIFLFNFFILVQVLTISIILRSENSMKPLYRWIRD